MVRGKLGIINGKILHLSITSQLSQESPNFVFISGRDFIHQETAISALFDSACQENLLTKSSQINKAEGGMQL